MTGLTPWALAELLSRLLQYVAIALLAGRFYIPLLVAQHPDMGLRNLQPTRFSTLLLALFGALAAVAFLLFQSGDINQQGLSGMFDPLMLGILWDTPAGWSLQLRLPGFGLILLGQLLLTTSGSASLAGLWGCRVCSAAGLLLLAMSFGFFGHTVELGVAARSAVSAHVLVAMLWVGSLLPLLKAVQTQPASQLIPILRKFGQLGWIKVGVLLATGLFLVFSLLDSWSALWLTPYGRLLGLKLLLVLLLLFMAALNKFRLVAAVERGKTAGMLKKSIVTEILLAALILVLTSILTTVLGPETMS